MTRSSNCQFAVLLTTVLLAAHSLLAQGPRLSFLTDPQTDLGFASCHVYFEGGAQRKIPFLPVVNAKGAPCGSERYSRSIELKAPIVFVGDGIVRASADPYEGLDVEGRVVMLSFDFPDKTHPDSGDVPMEERVREAVRRKAAGVLLFSALQENPFPRYRENDVDAIPEIPIIATNRGSAAVILASSGRDPEETFRTWESEGSFRPGVLITKLDLRIDSRFEMIETDHVSFAFQPGIPVSQAKALADTSERAIELVVDLFKDADLRWEKSFTTYFASYDAKVFYVHHWGKGLSSDAGIFMLFDGTAPDFGLAAHENAHTLVSSNWGDSSSFLVEGIGKYAEAMATDEAVNHRTTKLNLNEGTLFPLGDMATISIGSDPRTPVAYPAAGSFVQFIVDRYSLAKLKEIYQRVGHASDDEASRRVWVAVFGKSLTELESEWLAFLRAI